ncbi:MAG: anti-sigma factor family protein [Solirubrobacteraceae bacterium]
MTDESKLPEAELAALADGSLPADRREQLRAAIQASPELQAALAEQERAVTMLRALDQPAPASLRASVGAITGRPSISGGSRWRRTLVMPAAAALAIVLAALVVALGDGSTVPTVPQTARLALAAATAPAPAQDAAHPGLLRLRVDGLAFPYYGRSAGWEATGTRTDKLGGRQIVTVSYTAPGADRVGYAIVSGRALPVSGGTSVSPDGVRYTLQNVGGARLVTWQRDGHTCVIAGRTASDPTLLALAVAEERGPAS